MKISADLFDWRGGEVYIWNLRYLSSEVSLVDQIDELDEDLAQIYYTNNKVIDIGWYPDESKPVFLTVCVFNNDNWYRPIFKRECSDVENLINSIKEAISVAVARAE